MLARAVLSRKSACSMVVTSFRFVRWDLIPSQSGSQFPGGTAGCCRWGCWGCWGLWGCLGLLLLLLLLMLRLLLLSRRHVLAVLLFAWG